MNEKNNNENGVKIHWATFIESEAADFFNRYELEKMSLEDGDGNKARLTRQKDFSIKVEYSTVTII